MRCRKGHLITSYSLATFLLYFACFLHCFLHPLQGTIATLFCNSSPAPESPQTHHPLAIISELSATAPNTRRFFDVIPKYASARGRLFTPPPSRQFAFIGPWKQDWWAYILAAKRGMARLPTTPWEFAHSNYAIDEARRPYATFSTRKRSLSDAVVPWLWPLRWADGDDGETPLFLCAEQVTRPTETTGSFVPHECALFPERVTEYPYI